MATTSGKQLRRSWTALCISAMTLLLAPALLPAAGADLAELRPGRWVEVPDSRLRSVAPAVSPGGNVAKVVAAWSGGALDTKRERLLVWGGGHSNYAGNEVYAFDLREMRWSRLSDPSVANDDKAATYPDGQPRARHTYNYIEYVPAWDRLVSFGGSGPWPRGGGEFTREISEFDFDEQTWTTGARPAVPAGGSMIAAIARTDPTTGDVYFVPGASAALMRFDPVTQQWHGGWGRGYLTAHATAAIDPRRRLMVAVGKGAKDGTSQIWLWDLRQPSAPVKLLGRTSGDKVVEKAMAPGFAYHPPSGKFVAWIGGTDVYTLDPDRWEWQRVPAAPDNVVDPGPQTLRGTYGRFQYVPGLDAFALVNSVDQNVFLLRPDLAAAAEPPTDGSGSPPVVTIQATPARVVAGESTTLSWTADGADACAASDAWRGQLPTSGTRTLVVPSGRARYSMKCTGAGGTTEAAVLVEQFATPSVTMQADPVEVESGGSTTLQWRASGATGCLASGDWHGPRPAAGTERVANLLAGAEFVLECAGTGGVEVAQVGVEITSAKPAVVGTDGGAGQSGGVGHTGLFGNGVLLMLGAAHLLGKGRLRASRPNV